MSEKEQKIDLKQILEEASMQTLDPSEALSLIAQRFLEPFREEELLTILSELNNNEIISIARLYPVIQTIESHYQIQTPLGNFIRFVLLGRISKYRKGRKEILDLVSRMQGYASDFSAQSGFLKRLFGKD